MFPRLITEAEVQQHLTVPEAIEAVDEAFRRWAAGEAQNVPRSRAAALGAMLHMLSATAAYLGLMGWKAYTTTRGGARFHAALYSIATGEPLALFEANHLGQIRTGAATAVATRALARPDAETLGLFGTGFQARTQLLAICHVRPIRRVRVYGRDPTRRTAFALEISKLTRAEVLAVDTPEAAVRDCDIVTCATTSRVSVFQGDWLAPGTHVNAVGSNLLSKAEIDVATVERAGLIACDSVDQCRLEAGDFVPAMEAGVFEWSRATELRDVLAGTQPGRTAPEQITLFKSVGLGLEDVAAAAVVLKSLGVVIP
jgi:alanine dehydrogenase